MNWLAFDPRAYGAAVLGCLLALWLAGPIHATEADLPFIFGLLAGLGCAAVAGDRSGPRGLVVAVLAVWAAALHEVTGEVGWSLPAIGSGLRDFHRGLVPLQVAAYCACFGIALVLAQTSLRRGATRRLAGL